MKTTWNEFKANVKEEFKKQQAELKRQQEIEKNKAVQKQVECPKCKSFKIQSAREKLVITSLAMIFASPWLLILMILIGPFAIAAAIGTFVLGVVFLLVGIFAKELSKDYNCQNCEYNWKGDNQQDTIK